MVAFTKIPANTKTPLFHQEQDNSAAGGGALDFVSVIVASILASATASAGDLVPISDPGQAALTFGRGSQAHKMAETYLAGNQTVPLKVLAVADGTTPGALPLTITGAATADGELAVYIAGEKLSITVSDTDTPTIIGDAIAAALGIDEAAAVTAKSEFQVTATNAIGVVTFTSRQSGVEFNDIEIEVNLNEETLPAGIAVAGVGRLTGGAGNPDITSAMATLLEEEFSYLASGFTDAGNMTVLRDFFDDTTGRWSDGQQLYGHIFTARNEDFATLIAFGLTGNNQHETNVGIFDSSTPNYQIAAAATASASGSLSVHPALPLQTLVLKNVVAPVKATRFIRQEREQLLSGGIATTTVNPAGQVAIERFVTGYRVNSFDSVDESYLDINTLAINEFRMRDMRTLVESKFARKVLVDSGTLAANNENATTPEAIRSELIARYQELEFLAIVENTKQYAKDLVVERVSATRVDILDTPINAGQLIILALRNQFRTSANL